MAGTYTVDVNGQSGTFTVKAAPSQPAPAEFKTGALTIWPSQVNIGESVSISALVANTGDLAGSYKVILKINNIVVDTKDITIDGHSSKAVTFTTSKGVAGTYTVDIDGQSGTFTVTAPIEKVRPHIPWWVWLIVGLAVVAVIGVIVWLVVIRPRFWIFFTGGRIVILRKK